jgi:hypothetical protein
MNADAGGGLVTSTFQPVPLLIVSGRGPVAPAESVPSSLAYGFLCLRTFFFLFLGDSSQT